MLPQIVFVTVGVIVFALCPAANCQNSVRQSSIWDSQYIADIVASSRNGGMESATIPSIPTSIPTATPTQINDKDYWDNDDFQPYKIDNRDYFDWRLLEEIFTKKNTNVVISPFSIKLVLALLSEAADAESVTKHQLSSIFHKSTSPFTLREHYKELLTSLMEPSDKYTLNIGTKLYIRNSLRVREQYQKTLKNSFQTDVQPLDFSEAQESANIINKWCSNITEGHLQNLVTSDNIQNSVLLLINAVYFDGKWRTPFTEIFESVFFRQPTEQIRANYMTIEDKFWYFQSTMWSAKVVRLPYQGKKFSMTVILPDAKGGIESLIRDMEGDSLRRIQWLMTEQTVKVTIPKFKFDFTSHMKEHLQELGINEIFSDTAALGGIVQGSSLNGNLKVSGIIQKAGIEVHETGTTAFAATDVEIVNKFGGDTVEEFNVNRPFVFLIMDEATSNIIFAGKVLDPTV